MENLTPLMTALDACQIAQVPPLALSLGSFSRLPAEIRLMIYEFSCGDIYADENFKSPDKEIAKSFFKTCSCCGGIKDLPKKTSQIYKKFIRAIVATRRATRRRAFDIYFNLTFVNKAMYNEAQWTMNNHYRSQLKQACQIYYICLVDTSDSGGEHRKCDYRLVPHDLWAPIRSTATGLAELRLPKLSLAFCNGGLVNELGEALQAAKATQSLRIHIEDLASLANEVDFFDARFAWTKLIEDTRITGRSCCQLWVFQADSRLSKVRKENENQVLPFILDETLTGTLKYFPYQPGLFLAWKDWVKDEAQKDYDQERMMLPKARRWSYLGGQGRKAKQLKFASSIDD